MTNKLPLKKNKNWYKSHTEELDSEIWDFVNSVYPLGKDLPFTREELFRNTKECLLKSIYGRYFYQ